MLFPAKALAVTAIVDVHSASLAMKGAPLAMKSVHKNKTKKQKPGSSFVQAFTPTELIILVTGAVVRNARTQLISIKKPK